LLSSSLEYAAAVAAAVAAAYFFYSLPRCESS
jgi:hypothetical protein